MADSRRTRDYQPELTFPGPDRMGVDLGGPANEGLSLPSNAPLSNDAQYIEEGSGVRVDPRSFASGTVPAYVNPDDDAISGTQFFSGMGQLGSAVGNDLASLGRLGMRGLDAITPSRDTLAGIGQYFQDAHAIGTGQTPLYMMQQAHMQNMQQNQQMMAFRRQQMADQLQQLRESKRQHDMQLLEKAMANPRASALLEQLGQDPNYSMAPQAAMLHKGMKDADYGSFDAYKQFIPEDVQARFISGQLPQHELNGWLDMAREDAKVNAKANAKSMVLSRAMNKDASARTPFEAQLVEEHQAEQETKRLKDELTQSQITKNNAEADKKLKELETGGAKTSPVINSIAQAFHGADFNTLPGHAQRDVMNRYSQLYAQGKQEVQQASPVSVKERSDVVDRDAFLKTGAMNRPKPGVTNAELSKGNFIQMSDTQQKQAADIERAGGNLKQLFNLVRPLIKAKSPMEAATQAARLHAGAFSGQNADAATYKAGSEAFSSQLARAFGGEVGTMTDRDITRWQNTLPTFGDTERVAGRKETLFMNIYDTANQAFRNQVAGVSNDEVNKKMEELLKQADSLKGDSKQQAAPSASGAGEIKEGKGGKKYRFKGGDRTDKNNWELVQ